MSHAYRLLFHLARAIAIDHAARVGGTTLHARGPDTCIGEDIDHAHALHCHDTSGDTLQSLGRAGDGPAPVPGARRGA